jgi:hypothetical protein
MLKTVEMDLEFMNQIPAAPRTAKDMYSQACSNDAVTVNAWADRWLSNIRANHTKYGPFRERSIGKLFGKFKHRPIIVAGSGPSLKNNIEDLKDPKGVPVISCLHNFHYMEDHGVPVDFYVTLDAGDITIEEISEGGSKSHEEYLEMTRGKTLLAFIGSPPKLLESWQGEVLFFNCPIPDHSVMEEVKKIEHFYTYVSTGGNVLGACTYIAKAILGCTPIAFVGADFCFSYTKQFHPWKSKYDGQIGEAMRGVDVFGNKVLTWQSYWNFKVWFDWLAGNVTGLYINCTEGGLLGAYPEGNIAQIQQMTLKQFLWMYSMHEMIRAQCENPCLEEKTILF